jgi:PAS domain S-box-containing protein
VCAALRRRLDARTDARKNMSANSDDNNVIDIRSAVANADARDGGQLDFLAGGGEMGARMRALDWILTPVGPPAQWPQSLKTIVRVMLDSRYAMWMAWGRELTFFCNDAYAPTLGIKRDTSLGTRSEKVWTEIWSDIGPRINHVLQSGEATWDEGLLLFLERSGFPEETYHTFSYSPVYDDASNIAGMLCVVTEVTERVIGERRLLVLRDLSANASAKQSAEESCVAACAVLARYPFDVPFAGVYLIGDAAGPARRVAATHELPEAALPATLPLDSSSAYWTLQQMLASRTPQELRNLPAKGIHVTAGPWPDEIQNGTMIPLMGTGSELAGFMVFGYSPRRPLGDAYRSFLSLVAGQVESAVADAQAYEAERGRAEALAELDRAKTAFFSNVSHEFRTPLTLLLGPIEEALADQSLSAQRREQFELALRNARRLQRLVNSLLDFSRLEAGRVRASYEETDLAQLTRDIASTFRSAMEKGGLAFEVKCNALGATAFVDRDMWEKIVLNLLSNAFKFTLEGGVTISLREEGGVASLKVADTGVGIPEHEVPRLFERFHRIEGILGRTQEGTGIGLALVQELVKLHGGTVAASSRPGAGTVFEVRIPLGSAHLPEERLKPTRTPTPNSLSAQSYVNEAMHWLDDPAEREAATLHASDSPDTLPDRRFAATFGARIVLADDNADMRAYVRGLLSPYYTVESFADGMQALASVRLAPPDLILSDVMMPRLDGFGLLDTVRGDPALRSTPVVLLSARAGEEARIEGLDSGADDYLVKPFSARELLARVGALLELRHMRAAADQAFRRRTAQFETLLNEAPLGVYLIDADFCVREANPAARVVFGPIPDLIGRNFGEVLHMLWQPALADDIAARFRHTLTTGEPYHVAEYAEQRTDRGVTEYYEWHINRIPLPDGRFGVVCYFRDISTHVRARAQLETADRQKDEFLAMLAHELRNPLAPIRNAGEVLERLPTLDTQARSAVGIVQRQVGNLTRIVDDLLDVSRITLGHVELQRQPLQLGDIVAQAVEVVEPLVRERRQHLSVTSHQFMRLNADPARLVQCIANVLANASKYTDTGGTIRLETRGEDGQATVTVSDNGSGIAKDLLPKVFDLFVQGDRTLDRAQGGLGIGLSVVKRLVEMHGGKVTATSEGPGRGSTFVIRLPLLEDATAAAAPAPAPELAPQRILVVDDNVDAADSLAMVLRLVGHEVEVVTSAQQALAVIATLKPDTAILDIGLPGMTGHELAARIRELPGLKSMRLIALTGYGQAEDRQRAQTAGFDAHLVKPAELNALQRVLGGASG